MLAYVARRLVQAILVLLILSALTFSLLHLSGNPASLLLPADATPEQIENMSQIMGLNLPIYVQYARFLGRLSHGDLGTSYRMNRPVWDIITTAFPHTLKLGACAMLFASLLSLPLGMVAAVKRDSIVDLGATFFATLGQSMPTFWIAILLMLTFSVKLDLLPVSGTGSLLHYVLPTLSLGWYSNALLTRVIRSSMLEVLNQDYIRTARSKGLRERVTILKHGLRNASLPVITIWGMQLGTVLMGSVATETVFGWPGIGRLSVDAILGRDYPIVMGVVLTFGALLILLNLLVDLSYAFLDPRIAYS
ncbi:ABC transporter permease [Candidatus Bipolaricaulota bacterium]|nr:ABC transporter permease [Candidatus Bipolaricaulota bacterium]